ncbi:hypothetical protein AB0I28_25440 [Phytomonospora sp. NPDC050363]|uniref:hypothetical protein n=1 Tax=Phytomonospora sp. NPDC050363 TaxID=3155642 RepID=UPI0033C18927
MADQHPPEQGYPSGGFTVPRPFQIAKRIPEDLPFVLRPSKGRTALIQGGSMSVALLPFLCCIGVLTSGAGIMDTPSILLALLLPLVLLAPLFLLVWLLAVLGGPTLAADEHGLWIRARKMPVKAIWLPWESIARIYTRRWMLDRAVCVQPHDPAAGSGTGIWAAMDQGMAQTLLGSKFNASATLGDKREPEILAALAHFSRGRTYIG